MRGYGCVIVSLEGGSETRARVNIWGQDRGGSVS